MSGVSVEELALLNALAAEHGAITPALVLAAAEDPSSPLHNRFTWDDTEAAVKQRLSEARTVIMQVRVKMTLRRGEPPISVRAFVSLASDRLSGDGYRPIGVVLSDPDMRDQLLATALGELQALHKRYGHLSELVKVFEAINAVAAGEKAVA